MLDYWIIKEIEKRKEQEEREQEDRRLPFYVPDYYPESDPDWKKDEERPSRVIIIDPDKDDKKPGSVEIDLLGLHSTLGWVRVVRIGKS